MDDPSKLQPCLDFRIPGEPGKNADFWVPPPEVLVQVLWAGPGNTDLYYHLSVFPAGEAG